MQIVNQMSFGDLRVDLLGWDTITVVTLLWIALPLFVGFSIYLLPKLDRALAMGVALISLLYGLWQVMQMGSVSIQLVDSFGVSLLIDRLSGYFILTNGVVTAAVILYCWQQQKSAFFFTQAIILHGSVNAVFICADLISLYVALEVVSIAAFLLISYPRTNSSIWVGLRYLFVSNTAMLFYVTGALFVYQASHSFAFTGLMEAPVEAIALIFLGPLSKGGIFVSGLWLPLTHAESETPVSALLSGIVIKAGVFPLVRFSLLFETLEPRIQLLSVATAILGTSLAIVEQDTKRTLAWSTISQMGFILAAPFVAGFYALTHGLAKSALFLTVGKLSSRDFATLRKTPIPLSLWSLMAIASLSIAGFPLLAGYDAKISTLKQLAGWPSVTLNIVAVGTAVVFAKYIFLPFQDNSSGDTATARLARPAQLPEELLEEPPAQLPKQRPVTLSTTAWWAIVLLLVGLIAASALHTEDYTLSNLAKALGKIGLGFLVYQLVVRRLTVKLPQAIERLEHLIGVMSVMLTVLFWLVMP